MGKRYGQGALRRRGVVGRGHWGWGAREGLGLGRGHGEELKQLLLLLLDFSISLTCKYQSINRFIFRRTHPDLITCLRQIIFERVKCNVALCTLAV